MNAPQPEPIRPHPETPGQAPRQPRAKRRTWWIWPGIVLLLLLAHAATITYFMTTAVSDENFAAVPDAYERGLGYDRRKARLQRTVERGWEIGIETADRADAAGNRLISVELTGPGGSPIDDARMKVVLTRHAGGGASDLVQLGRTATPGRYAAPAPLGVAGVYAAEFVAERGRGTEIEKGLFDRELRVGMADAAEPGGSDPE